MSKNVHEFKYLIGDRWVATADGSHFENRNPATLGTVLCTFPKATREHKVSGGLDIGVQTDLGVNNG